VDGSGTHIDFLVASLDRSVAELRRGVDSLDAVPDLQGTSFPTYVRISIDGVAGRANDLVEEARRTADPVDHASIATQLRRLHQLVSVLHRQAGLGMGLKTESIGLGIVYFVKEAADAIVRGDSQLIIRPDTEHTYSSLGQHRVFKSVFNSVRVQPPQGPVPVLIQYPWAERQSVAVHALFLHELGHEAAQRDGLTDEVWARHPDLPGLDRRFADAIEQIVAGHTAAGRSISSEEVETSLRTQLDQWVEELLCDAIATAYAGPSYLLAFVAFLGSSDHDVWTISHPAFADRVHYTLELADELGWAAVLDGKLGEIMQWIRSLAVLSVPAANDHRGSFVKSVIDELSPGIRGIAREQVGSSVFTPAAYGSAADEVEQLVRDGIPPVQLATKHAVGRREMFLGAWLGKLGHSGASPDLVPNVAGDMTLQALHGQALELSFLLEDWARP